MAIGKEIFTQILSDAEGRRVATGLSKKSINWFRKKVTRATKGDKMSTKSIMSRTNDMTAKLLIGRMYHFKYNAKWKEVLPYWDMFPLIIPVDVYADGFSGLNLHYLPPRLRAKLFDQLSSIVSDKNLNERAKFRISYNLLNGVRKYKLFKPTFKRYLYTQVRSRFLLMPPAEWQIALFLPTQRFQKAKSAKVWQESKRMAR